MPVDTARLEVALRVLASIATHRRIPPREDIAALWQLASSEAERAQPIDDLARAIVERECNLIQARTTSECRVDAIPNGAFTESRDAVSPQPWVSVSDSRAGRRPRSGHPVYGAEVLFVREIISPAIS